MRSCLMFLIGAVTTLLLTAAGCVSQPKAEAVLHESSRGAVSLERLPDRALQATHPIKLDTIVLQRLLQGVHVKGHTGTIQTLMAGESEVTPAFSPEDVAFLTPLLAQALQAASPEQQVRFTVIQPSLGLPSGKSGAGVGSSEPLSGMTTERTSGTLYAHGLSVHLALAEYRHRPERGDTINMPNRRLPDPTGLAAREVIFIPEEATRADAYKSGGLLGEPLLTTLVIDYEKLGRLAAIPAQAPARFKDQTAEPQKQLAGSVPAAPSDGKDVSQEDYQSVRDLVIKKDMELERLKSEMQSLRRQLADRDAQLETLKGKTKPAP